MLITEPYRQLNIAKHLWGGGYGTSGARWAESVDAIAKGERFRSVLDYGCGKGTLKIALPRPRDYAVREYDPAIPGKDEEPEPADLVVCGDVLEHVEPECLEEVLDHLRHLALRNLILVIHTGPARKTLADGRNAHLIIKPASWWLAKIEERWIVERFKGTKIEFSCLAGCR